MQFNDWLKDNNISKDLINIFNDNFPFGQEIGSVRFNTQNRIVMENGPDYWLDLFENKFVVFGDAINGDPWAFDTRSGALALVLFSHDEILESDEKFLGNSGFVKISDSFAEFMAMAKKDRLPFDYYDALDRIESTGTPLS